MSLPSVAAKIAKAGKKVLEADKKLEGTIEVAGRIMNKRDLVKFEIEKALRNGRSQADVSKSLKAQGLDVDPEWVKQQVAVAKRRDPVMKPDRRMREMEANFIIEKGLGAGRSWDEIGLELESAGFKQGSKLAKIAEDNYRKRLMHNSGPAVIDNGESGPMAPEDQPPVFDAEADARAKNRQVLDDSKKTDEDWQNEFKDIATKAGRLRAQAQKDLRGKSEAEIAASPWMAEMEGLVRSLRDSIIPTGARVMESVDPTNANSAPQNLDVPVPPAGINGPVEPEFRNQ